MICPECGLEMLLYQVTTDADGEWEEEYVCRNPRCGRYDRRLARKKVDETPENTSAAE